MKINIAKKVHSDVQAKVVLEATKERNTIANLTQQLTV